MRSIQYKSKRDYSEGRHQQFQTFQTTHQYRGKSFFLNNIFKIKRNILTNVFLFLITYEVT